MNESTESLPAALFERQDNTPDAQFYAQPRLVTHIDDATIASLTEFYREFLPAGCDLLDLMSSWISHLPDDVDYKTVTGHGMNAQELEHNTRLTDYVVQDLNTDPALPFADQSFDRACIVVSIQYLTNPVAVLRDVHRTLRAQGQLCIAMSHRCFPTKAIRAFHILPPSERMALVDEYLRQAGFTDIKQLDRSPANADPLWIVTGKRA